jgi:hypothetical protein
MGRYGFFRDELYFLVCGQRLETGYVDQPPGIALLARLAGALFGIYLPGLRLFSWLAGAATVYLSGRLAARLSGSGAAATLASTAAFACPLLLGTSHLLTMNAFEPLLVLSSVLLLLRLSEGQDPRLFVPALGLLGLSVLVKYSSAAIGLALFVGFLATPARRSLCTVFAPIAALFAALLLLPNVLWQASHGFPFLEVVRNGQLHKNALLSPLGFLEELLLEANPLTLPLWLFGLAFLLFGRGGRKARFLGIACLLYLAAVVSGHGKPYYAAPILPLLFGAGGAAVCLVVGSRPRRLSYGALLAASGLALSPLALPLLTEETFLSYERVLGMRPAPMEQRELGPLPQLFADQHGWHELVLGVARVYASLPKEEQDRALVYGLNYGVASAVEVLGPALGLPKGIAVSGHNQFWFWGLPEGRGDPFIMVSGESENCGGAYREVVLAERLPRTPYAMPYENGHWLWICRGALARSPWWPGPARHFQ